MAKRRTIAWAGALWAWALPAAAQELDLGLLAGHPAVLDTGLTLGAVGGVVLGDTFTWGAHAAWSTATEYTTTRTIVHDEIRLRLEGGLRTGPGVGTAGLRLALGTTAVREVATRNQGARAGLTGSALETTAWRLVPGGELEAVFTLRLFEGFGAVIHGGPSLHVLAGTHRGFAGGVGLVWWP